MVLGSADSREPFGDRQLSLVLWTVDAGTLWCTAGVHGLQDPLVGLVFLNLVISFVQVCHACIH